MKELDLLLRAYLEQHWPAAASGDRDAFARLLELPDPELASYLLGHAAATDNSLGPVLAVLRGLAARRAASGPLAALAAATREPGSDLR
jgi:succinate dehydrogenase flavin-adding protein (antitoxin of CptAB toxin-antitoxin module)